MRNTRTRRTAVWASVMAVGVLGVASPGRAQTSVGMSVDWWDWIGDARVHGSLVYRSGDPIYPERGYAHPPVGVYERGVRRRPVAGRGRSGPAFCRSGRGHPVHGWRWCVEKGFAAGRPARYRIRGHRRVLECCAWRPVDLGPVRFRSPRYDRTRRILVHAEVVTVLGVRVVDRLRSRSRQHWREPLEARWYPAPSGVRVLQVRSGAIPVAEFTDRDGDRRVDSILFAERYESPAGGGLGAPERERRRARPR